MASPFIEQIMAQAIAASDPQVKAATQFLHGQAKVMEQSLITDRAATIEIIEAKLSQAVENQARPAVINAYESLLASAVS